MNTPKKVVIIGGVAGGASAAARIRRLSEAAEITLVERGGDISFANCGMPYHVGGVIRDRDRLLVQTPAAFTRRFNVNVHVRTEAVRIDAAGKRVLLRDLASGAEQWLEYDALVLSPGAEPVRPPIPGLTLPQVHVLRNLADMDAIKARVDGGAGGHTVVIGGGYIGLEMTEALRERGLPVTLVELSGQVMGPSDPEMVTPVHQEILRHGVDLRLHTSVEGVEPDGEGVKVKLSDGTQVSAGLVVCAIGVRPEAKLAREAGLKLGAMGGIAVDAQMRTSDPAIWAVGDAVEVEHLVGGGAMLIPLAGPANRQGRVAADSIFGRESSYRKTQGTAICKVFDLAIAGTGHNEKTLKRLGMAYEKVYVHPASHAGYYPGAMPLSMKLTFEPKSGKLLGAQVVGSDGVDKRIDVLATAIRAGMTVFDLEHLELSYAPPFGSAKDPVNFAGFVAANALRGDVALCHVADLVQPKPNQVLLDVRTPAEFAAGTIPGAILLPVDDLRTRMAELPKDKEILVFCRVGMRGYLACRTLKQNGFACRNLTGGYLTYQAVTWTPPKINLTTPPTESQMRTEMKDDAGTRQDPAQGRLSEVDCRGLQCPGPIMRLAKSIDGVSVGDKVRLTADDPAFRADVESWCRSTGNILEGIEAEGRTLRATIRKSAPIVQAAGGVRQKEKTIVVFSGDFDKVTAAMVIANGALAMGSKVTMFFTFWGLNALRKPENVSVQKNLVERMFGWMMPRGARKLKLSQMHMAGMGTAMIKGIMKSHNVPLPEEMIRQAQAAGVRLVACTMSMDLMGIRKEELIDGVESGGVATFLESAERGDASLFI